jgi:hypothetical protein
VLKSISVAPNSKAFPERGYREVKVRLQYNPRSWLESRQGAKISGLGFDLVDDTGKKYTAVSKGHSLYPTNRNNQYELRYDFLIDQLIPQMPAAAKKVTLKSKITGPDGSTLPIEAVVYRRE